MGLPHRPRAGLGTHRAGLPGAPRQPVHAPSQRPAPCDQPWVGLACELAAARRLRGRFPRLPHPGWATPYCLLLWNVLNAHPQARRKAAAWLLDQKGDQAEGDKVLIQMIVGDDQSILGWPWVAGTHSWLEPTASSIIALDREGLGDHPRVEEGIRMILDRALTQGGWNYGNKSVFGKTLRPHPGPTGMALVALAARTGNGTRRPRRGPGHRLSQEGTAWNRGARLTGLGRAWVAGLGRLSRRMGRVAGPVVCDPRPPPRHDRRACAPDAGRRGA